MRLLIATQHATIVGGVETYLRNVLPLLAAANFETGVLAAQGTSESGIAVGFTGVSKWITPQNSKADVLSEVDRWNPAVVYSQGLHDPGLEAALAHRYPTVLFAHNYSGMCVSGTKCFSRPHYETCQRTLGMGCLAAYLPRGCGGRNPLTMVRLYCSQKRRARAMSQYRAILVASRHMANEFLRQGISQECLNIVPLFPADAAPDLDPPRQRLRTDRVLFVGRVTLQKGLSHLIAAIPSAEAELGRKLKLIVAGDGPARGEAESASRQRGIDASFLGWINADQRQAAMRNADVLAIPSVWPEPFGLVGIEAGCFGLPAVGYASGGIPDWLIPGVSGESAPGARPDPTELVLAMVRALADDTHWQRLRVGAWETARRFAPQAHMRLLCGILKRVAITGSQEPTQ